MNIIKNAIQKLNFDNNPMESEVSKELKATEKSFGIDFVCEAAGVGGVACYGVECKAHIITRHFTAIKSSEMNIVKVCKGHENYFNKVGLEVWYRWVKQEFPVKFEFVLKQHKGALKQLKQAEFVVKEYDVFLQIAEQ